MNPFSFIFENFVYRPEVNLLKLFYILTGNNIGLSIILLATAVNVILWPLFISTYLNSQKVRYLQPRLKVLQEKYKDKQQDLLKATMEFNRQHGVNNSTFLWVIVAQILVATGLWTITNNLSGANNEGLVTISGLYEWAFGANSTQFNTNAFGLIDIHKQASNAIYIPILNSVFSFLYGMYSFRWAPKLPEIIKPKPKKAAAKDKPAFDPESFQKSIEFQTIYFMPAFLFFFNYNLSVGVNIYFATVSFLSLVRQIFITKYYASHTHKFVEDLAKSDPEFEEVIDVLPEPVATATPKNAPKTAKKKPVSTSKKKTVKKVIKKK
jgi:YidC/Oxa1 family membrane protein insertase